MIVTARPRSVHRRRLAVATLAVLALAGCQSAYYGALEKVGLHKRDILVDRVEAARDSQEATKEQFRSALERFTEVVRFDGGALAEKYETLNRELERSAAKAAEVTQRIDSVEDVADALFREWRDELALYSDAGLRRSSARQLADTRASYGTLIAAMRRAEGRIEPVLATFRDQVLYLKHNLNARAVAALEGELANVSADVAALVREMNASIDEANEFVRGLEAA